MENIELISFQIISLVGRARSMYVEAIQLAKEGKYDSARNLIDEGDKVYIEGHRFHAKLIQQESNGERVDFQLLLTHAQDQLMSTESFKIVALEFINIYEKLGNVK